MYISNLFDQRRVNEFVTPADGKKDMEFQICSIPDGRCGCKNLPLHAVSDYKKRLYKKRLVEFKETKKRRLVTIYQAKKRNSKKRL